MKNPNDTYVNHKPDILFYLLVFALLLHIATTLLLASVPPVSRDALTHHLAIPKLYLKHGGIYEIPSLVFSYYPMNLDLLYIIPLAMGNDIVPNYIHFVFALLTAWTIYAYLKKRININYGLLGSLFFLSIPIIVQLSITAYVDLGLVFFSTAAMLLLFQWLEKKRIHALIMAGICCGIALGVKYNGLITLTILFFFTILLHLRMSQKPLPIKSIWFGTLFLGISLLIFSPWLLRNYSWTGNPVYPLFNSFFNPEALQSAHGLPPALERKILYHEQWWQILLTPFRIFFSGQDNDPQYFDGKLSPFLLILPVFSFLLQTKGNNKSENLEKLLMLVFSIFFLLFVFLQTAMRIRYVAPIIPPLIILSIFGLRNIATFSRHHFSTSPKLTASIIPNVLTLAMLFYNFSYMLKQYQLVKPTDYIFGKVTRQQYISHFRPEYPIIEWMNSNLPLQSKILAISLGNRSYYFDREVLFDFHELKSMICDFIKETKSDRAVLEKLQNLGITHLLVRYDIFRDWVKNDLNQDQQDRLNSFFLSQTKKIADSNNHGLYGLIIITPSDK
jgi:hypothetical protein